MFIHLLISVLFIFINSKSSLNFLSFNKDKKSVIRELLATINPKDANENCIKIDNYNLFNLFGMSKLKGYSKEFPSGTLKFNFCKNVEDSKSSVIFITKGTNPKKIRLSGNINGEEGNKNKVILDYHGNGINQGNMTTKITLKLNSGDKCISDQKIPFQFSFNVICNTYQKDEPFLIYPNDYNINSQCSFELNCYSELACGKKGIYLISLYMEKRIWIFGSILIILGFVFGIFGYKFKKLTIIASCGVIFLGIVNILLKYFDDVEQDARTIILIASIVMGLAIGSLFACIKKLQKVFMLLLGGGLGYFLGLYLGTLFPLFGISINKIIIYIIIVVNIIAFALIGFFFIRHIYLTGTSIFGGYCIMRGIALFLKNKINYLDGLQIFDLAITGNVEIIGEAISWIFIIYPVILIIFSVIFCIIQYKMHPPKDQKDELNLTQNDIPILPD